MIAIGGRASIAVVLDRLGRAPIRIVLYFIGIVILLIPICALVDAPPPHLITLAILEAKKLSGHPTATGSIRLVSLKSLACAIAALFGTIFLRLAGLTLLALLFHKNLECLASKRWLLAWNEFVGKICGWVLQHIRFKSSKIQAALEAILCAIVVSVTMITRIFQAMTPPAAPKIPSLKEFYPFGHDLLKLLDLVDDGYHSVQNPNFLTPNWERIPPESLLVSPSTISPEEKTNLPIKFLSKKVRVYRNPNSVVIVLVGTRPTDPGDWIENIRETHGGGNDQETALLFVRCLLKNTSLPLPLLVTGHSKGGAMALHAALEIRDAAKVIAVSFNSAGLPRLLLEKYGGTETTHVPHAENIVACYCAHGDLVSNIAGTSGRPPVTMAAGGLSYLMENSQLTPVKQTLLRHPSEDQPGYDSRWKWIRLRHSVNFLRQCANYCISRAQATQSSSGFHPPPTLS